MTTIEQDLELATKALRRIAGTNPISRVAQQGPGNAAILDSFTAMKAEAVKALDTLFEREYERQAVEAERVGV